MRALGCQPAPLASKSHPGAPLASIRAGSRELLTRRSRRVPDVDLPHAAVKRYLLAPRAKTQLAMDRLFIKLAGIYLAFRMQVLT